MAEIDPDPRGRSATAEVNYSVFRLSRALQRAVDDIAHEQGVTLPQLLVLKVLGEGVPLSNAQLARRTFVSSQACHVVVGEVVEAGLAERTAHPTNLRMRLVALTEAGWQTLERCRVATDALEERLSREAAPAPDDTLATVVDRAAEVLAGGYFGDIGAEKSAAARRRAAAGSK